MNKKPRLQAYSCTGPVKQAESTLVKGHQYHKCCYNAFAFPIPTLPQNRPGSKRFLWRAKDENFQVQVGLNRIQH